MNLYIYYYDLGYLRPRGQASKDFRLGLWSIALGPEFCKNYNREENFRKKRSLIDCHWWRVTESQTYIVHRPRSQLTLTAASYLSVGLSVQENFKHLWTQNAWLGLRLGLLPPAGPDHVLVAQLGGGRHLPRRHGGRGPVSPPFPSWGSEDKSSRGGELIFCRIEHLGPHTMAFQLLSNIMWLLREGFN